MELNTFSQTSDKSLVLEVRDHSYNYFTLLHSMQADATRRLVQRPERVPKNFFDDVQESAHVQVRS